MLFTSSRSLKNTTKLLKIVKDIYTTASILSGTTSRVLSILRWRSILPTSVSNLTTISPPIHSTPRTSIHQSCTMQKSSTMLARRHSPLERCRNSPRPSHCRRTSILYLWRCQQAPGSTQWVSPSIILGHQINQRRHRPTPVLCSYISFRCHNIGLYLF